MALFSTIHTTSCYSSIVTVYLPRDNGFVNNFHCRDCRPNRDFIYGQDSKKLLQCSASLSNMEM